MGQPRPYSDLTKNGMNVQGILVRFAVGQESFLFSLNFQPGSGLN